MPTSPARFEVFVNGRKVALSGVEATFGVLSVSAHWVKRNPTGVPPKMRAKSSFDEESFLREACALEVGALNTITNEHISWGRHELKPGDEVTLRVLPGGEFEAPKGDA